MLTNDIRNQDLPLPNVYFMTVQHNGQTYTTYIAADYSGAAVRKLQRLCVDEHGFRPVRANSDTKMRRLKLGDYLECPDAIPAALINAIKSSEYSTIKALENRRCEIDALVMQLNDRGVDPHSVDFADVEAQLAAALNAA